MNIIVKSIANHSLSLNIRSLIYNHSFDSTTYFPKVYFKFNIITRKHTTISVSKDNHIAKDVLTQNTEKGIRLHQELNLDKRIIIEHRTIITQRITKELMAYSCTSQLTKQQVQLLILFTKKLKDTTYFQQIQLLELIIQEGLYQHISDLQLTTLYNLWVRSIDGNKVLRHPKQLIILLNLMLERKYIFNEIQINELSNYILLKQPKRLANLFVPLLFRICKENNKENNDKNRISYIEIYNNCFQSLLMNHQFIECNYLLNKMRDYRIPLMRNTRELIMKMDIRKDFWLMKNECWLLIKWKLRKYPIIESNDYIKESNL
ncbi:hypothetical protein K502DRAFT_147984 [Neoconidiobolus thromboides FSU 785]|nr:hypothetical protein K502DRAFT_147984 [Neoconidiobolus thromboides FSU 785]